MSKHEAEHVRAAGPYLKLTLLIVGGIALACIVAGVVAMYLSSTGHTDIKLLGMDLSTDNVGVALVAIGVAALLLTVRKLLKTIHSLAKLRPDLRDDGRRQY